MNKDQVHLVKLFDLIEKDNLTVDYMQSYIRDLFPPGVIQTSIEYQNDNIYLITYKYRDGIQKFNGPTRDYRGECILYDDNNKEYYICRVSLPVFPDCCDIKKDKSAFEYINDFSKFDGEYHITPKFDGSLLVLSLIKKDSKQYDMIKKILPETISESWYENELGIWCIGSKNCMFSVENHTLSKFLKSINASYNSFEEFIQNITLQITKNKYIENDNISLMFESISNETSGELTVNYDKTFCQFLCYVLMNKNKEKRIVLPSDEKYINPRVNVKSFDAWKKVLEYKEEIYDKLLKGDETEEPEGFVVWFGTTSIGIKLKYDEYYAAHKPESKNNITLYKELISNIKYENLIKRFSKLSTKTPIKELISDDLDNLNNFLLLEYTKLSNSEFIENDERNNKKLWVFHLLKPDINELYNVYVDSIISKIENEGYEHFSHLSSKKQIFGILYYDNKNDWKNKICANFKF